MSASPAPFLILALPRSRTAWLSRFLAYGGRKVGHDLAVDCSSVNGFVAALEGKTGTVETGLAKAWPVLRRALPESKMVVVRRPVAEVLASLAKHGITGVDTEIEERAQALDQLSRRRGVVTIQYQALADNSVCALLFQHCLGIPYDHGWWSALDGTNVQIDLPAHIARIQANAERIAKFKAEVLRRLPEEKPFSGAIISLEPFGSIYPECVDLAKKHWDEVETDTDSRRTLNLNRTVLSQVNVQGFLKVFAARVDCKLVGYLFWTIQTDPESAGLLVGEQGAWYVSPEAPTGTAVRLYDRSIAELKALGVKVIYPHHRLMGRGSGLAKFFTRRGAVPEKQVYSLWIGD